MALCSIGCECQEGIGEERFAPDQARFTLWGMQSTDIESGIDLAGVAAYDIAVDVDGGLEAWLQFGSGTIRLGDVAETVPPDLVDDRPRLEEAPSVAVLLEQSDLGHPGTRRTLFRDDFGAARVEAVVGRTLYRDDQPTITLAFDLATGATLARVEGVLQAVGGEAGSDRAYAIDIDAVTPINCLYRSADTSRAADWRPPAGTADICAALHDKVSGLPTVEGTPARPWSPPGDSEMVCGI